MNPTFSRDAQGGSATGAERVKLWFLVNPKVNNLHFHWPEHDHAARAARNLTCHNTLLADVLSWHDVCFLAWR
jgi:hypothetical protein